MARRFGALFIAAYLGTLGYGLASHAIGYKTYAHLGMYFVVWDMFCGWTGWETRTHLLGEGESGAYYDLGERPWGDVSVYNEIDRRHYDSTRMHSLGIARNTAAHTEHEPLVRYLVVEEAWAKKYNLPESLWSRRFEEPRVFQSYNRIIAAYDGGGQLMVGNPNWQSWLLGQAMNDNPRLRKDVQQSTPFITAENFTRAPELIVPVGYQRTASAE